MNAGNIFDIGSIAPLVTVFLALAVVIPEAVYLLPRCIEFIEIVIGMMLFQDAAISVRTAEVDIPGPVHVGHRCGSLGVLFEGKWPVV
jgi:hypothetical protein